MLFGGLLVRVGVEVLVLTGNMKRKGWGELKEGERTVLGGRDRRCGGGCGIGSLLFLVPVLVLFGRC